MNNRQDLIDYLPNQKWINRQLEKYIEQKAMAERITQNLDGMPKAQNKPNDLREQLIDQYDVILKMLIDDQMKQNEIILILKKLKPIHRDVLTYLYLNGLSLQDTAEKMSIAYETASRAKRKALNEFDEICKTRQ